MYARGDEHPPTAPLTPQQFLHAISLKMRLPESQLHVPCANVPELQTRTLSHQHCIWMSHWTDSSNSACCSRSSYPRHLPANHSSSALCISGNDTVIDLLTQGSSAPVTSDPFCSQPVFKTSVSAVGSVSRIHLKFNPLLCYLLSLNDGGRF